MQVGHGGLEVVMSQSVFDIGCRETSGEHVHGAGMPQAVNGINRSETFRGQSDSEVFSAETIDFDTYVAWGYSLLKRLRFLYLAGDIVDWQWWRCVKWFLMEMGFRTCNIMISPICKPLLI